MLSLLGKSIMRTRTNGTRSATSLLWTLPLMESNDGHRVRKLLNPRRHHLAQKSRARGKYRIPSSSTAGPAQAQQVAANSAGDDPLDGRRARAGIGCAAFSPRPSCFATWQPRGLALSAHSPSFVAHLHNRIAACQPSFHMPQSFTFVVL